MNMFTKIRNRILGAGSAAILAAKATAGAGLVAADASLTAAQTAIGTWITDNSALLFGVVLTITGLVVAVTLVKRLVKRAAHAV